ncbi:hypothetical protein SAMN04489742_4473 [Arthrobacter crystallopoietes]|uniref:Uncharacterized protein n=1 Tax=Crystallibacter crystallopoietes TaxID=37928 RepID=A0A1H1H0L6_9MICC|nr:hypothetical protein SAMN04489742_4473 [Arthrobacter crystallopoietes]
MPELLSVRAWHPSKEPSAAISIYLVICVDLLIRTRHDMCHQTSLVQTINTAG